MVQGDVTGASAPGDQAGARRSMSISTVQAWVLSVLAVTTILHFAMGLVVAAAYVDTESRKIGLLVVSGYIGVVAVGAGLAIHRRSLLSPWLLLGLLPAIVGVWFVLLR